MSEKAFPEPGFTAPDFSLPDHSGEQFTLSANRGRPVVVFFYPMDGTMVCTAQNKCVLDAYADFEGYNAVVVAISGGSIESRSRFVARYGFRHTMLVDEGRKVARRWGAVKLGIIPQRVTFVIAPDGRVFRSYSAMLQSSEHIRFALDALKELQGTSAPFG